MAYREDLPEGYRFGGIYANFADKNGIYFDFSEILNEANGVYLDHMIRYELKDGQLIEQVLWKSESAPGIP